MRARMLFQHIIRHLGNIEAQSACRLFASGHDRITFIGSMNECRVVADLIFLLLPAKWVIGFNKYKEPKTGSNHDKASAKHTSKINLVRFSFYSTLVINLAIR